MKRFLFSAVVLFAAATFAGDTVDPLVRLLNSRSAQSPKVYAKAAEAVRKAADSGGVLQQYVIAIVSEDARAPKAARLSADTRKAWLENGRAYVRELAEQMDDPMSWFLLSLEQDDLKALERAAKAGNVQAQNAWGTHLVSEAMSLPATNAVKPKVTALLEKGFECYKSAASKKDANGFYNLGMCYMQGYGCRRDAGLAFQCFRAAADAGHPEAINNIGGFYRDGILGVRDTAAATRWFQKSAELGNAYGRLNYALALQRGDGAPKDEKTAFALIRESADQDCAEAMAACGMCYLAGHGTEKNPAEAFRWFMRSAEAGFPPAMDNLAICYERGEGTARDIVKAAQWRMRFRAAMGSPDAKAWVARQDGRENVEDEKDEK